MNSGTQSLVAKTVSVALTLVFFFSASGAAAASALGTEIGNISDQVKQKKDGLKQLDQKAKEYEQVIAQKKEQSATLEDQLALIDNRIAKAQISIDIARDEIRSGELELAALDGQVAEKEKKIGDERQLLASLARKLYRQENSRTPFEVLISQKSFSEFFDALRAVVALQHGVDRTLTDIQTMSQGLKAERADRADKQGLVAARKRELEVAMNDLEDERSLKDAIITETKSSELHYRYLLAELKDEQTQADSEIQNLEKTLRDKMLLADRPNGETAVLSWPVAPTRGIAAKFHDPDYPFRYVFEHPAIDIRAYQGTAVRAASAGLVAIAKNAGMGYSYVMLMHANDVSTVYGHLSRIIVSAKQYVERGEIIGYSGGMPGTPGAGRLTTGPHLHFETRIKGVPVDPLNYLVAY